MKRGWASPPHLPTCLPALGGLPGSLGTLRLGQAAPQQLVSMETSTRLLSHIQEQQPESMKTLLSAQQGTEYYRPLSKAGALIIPVFVSWEPGTHELWECKARAWSREGAEILNISEKVPEAESLLKLPHGLG